MTNESAALREQLRRILSWQDAHVGFEKAVEGLAPKHRGVRVSGFPHSAWELVEHLRITQRDILDFCRDPSYEEPTWPDDYWPSSPQPPSEQGRAASACRGARATIGWTSARAARVPAATAATTGGATATASTSSPRCCRRGTPG